MEVRGGRDPPICAVFIRKDGYPLNGQQQQQEPSFHDASKWSSETLDIYVYLFPAGSIFSSTAGAWTKVECTCVVPHAVICDPRLQCWLYKFGAEILHSPFLVQFSLSCDTRPVSEERVMQRLRTFIKLCRSVGYK